MCLSIFRAQASGSIFGYVQLAFHLQTLAMTAQLASPGILEAYRDLALHWRWSLLAFKGNLGPFDEQFSNTQQHLPAVDVAGGLLAAVGGAEVIGAPPTATAQGRRMLLEAGSGNSSGGGKPLSDGYSVLYQSDAVLLLDSQDLLYALAVATIILGAVMLIHLLVMVLYVRCISAQLHPYLAAPRAEMAVGALLVVALTFYACLDLGSGGEGVALWRGSKAAAVVVLVLLTAGLTVFLWWLTLARVWARPQVSALLGR